MPQRKTPPLGLSGEYEVLSPFAVTTGMTYTCQALRSFQDLALQNVDVFQTFYESAGISYDVYEGDRDAGAVIVTLQSNSETLYIPDTYIQTIPYQGSEKMSLCVLSVDLGPLPDRIKLDALSERIGLYCTELLGYVPKTQLHRMPHTDSLTQEEIDNLELIREASLLIRKDLWTLYQEEKAKNERLQTVAEELERIVLENDLIPPKP